MQGLLPCIFFIYILFFGIKNMYFLGGKDMRSMDLIFTSNNYHQFTDIDDKVIFESAARKGYNDIINSFIEKIL